MRFSFFLFFLINIPGFTKNSGDTLLTHNSIQLDIGGTVMGIGISYEKALTKKNLYIHPKAFNSVDMTLSYGGYSYILTGIGFNRNWVATKSKRFYLNVGLNADALISLDPTPKALRQYYDSIHFYGGEYINPIEPYLFGNFGLKFFIHRFFIRANFTPLLFYDRVYKHRFYVVPWGGISFGLNFKK
ncbi:MAG: hypothetical protein NT084_02620 [Bacteroidetes bacterium]|jgi:hypothetical protein|nr:hypothetical protein [Bacteroidota bacterium]